jgi:hypothetical protein
MKKYNFDVIEDGGYFMKPFSHEQMWKLYISNIISEETLDGLYDMSKSMPEICSEIFVNVKVYNEN